MKNCETCFWWQPIWWKDGQPSGCNNTNWTTGNPSDPADPVCGGLSYRVIPIQQAPEET